ncbi:short-chain dehydrogenase [Catellatospora sp. IY07-71]|uniref:SDR family oxidoreductase n=1 Tax=Catellatospora sp. IY07-71 TaxID=2728827 RepID=UPI001BB40EDA|nr:SDR family oxidoreductase [Catellatospora sp. IY07-71]BCJ76356.1 short-chain dehydrogenase [Catellatospora sp. IY07-71]
MPLTRSIIESTVVITGASSGVGAATALTLARRGAQLVLAARSPRGLAQIGEQCRQLGADVLEVPTDTADPDAVERLAEAAQERFGHVDAWINNAGVALYGRLLDLPLDQVRRTIDVDVFGYLHGARAAVPRLRAAGGGVLIVVGSVLSEVSLPYLGAYIMAKHAVQGMADSLRQELRADGVAEVSVCTVLPGSLDTPLFAWAANQMGRQVLPPRPLSPPQEVADRIVRLLEHPRRQSFVGRASSTVMWQWRLAPALAERLLSLYGQLAQFGRPEPPSDGNLFEPVEAPRGVEGGWRLTPATLAGLPGTALAKVRHHLNGARVS